MSLTTILRTAPEQLRGKFVKQIIAFAGDGKLLDGSTASVEFREFLANVPSADLARYADECLADKFDNSGLALQDIVNQFGRRLGFRVQDGRYNGSIAHIGHDGLWAAPDGRQIVVEVKSSPKFRVKLESIAGYRRRLIREGTITEEGSSILIVVGQEGTEDLEAQIRGSRYAWDIRLISVEALKSLVHLKEGVDAPATAKKITEILIPYEYTRVDKIIDLVFSATEEVSFAAEDVLVGPEQGETSPRASVTLPVSRDAELQEAPESGSPRQTTPVNFNEACAARVSDQLRARLVKRSRTLFSTPEEDVGVVCLVSKEHGEAAGRHYWYGFHRYQEETLHEYATSYVAFGCGSPETVLLIPFPKFESWLDGMNYSERNGGFYRHVQIFIDGSRLVIHRRKGEDWIDVTEYLVRGRA